MKTLKKSLIPALFFIIMISVESFSQNKTLNGMVISPDSIPVKNAQVSVKGSNAVVSTDSSGCFSIASYSGKKIKIEAEGYIPKEFKPELNETKNTYILAYDPSNPRNLKIVFKGDEPNTLILNGRKEDITGYHNIFELLSDKVAGVLVYDTEDYKKIVIRGVSTINVAKSDPLVVIDGVLLDVKALEYLAVPDISTIDIIKNSSASRYGSKGGSGVIEITTKRGKSR